MIIARILSVAIPRSIAQFKLRRELIPLIIFAYACLLPRELSIEVVGAALFPYRLLLIVLAPYAIARLILSHVRPSLVDLFAIIASIWFLIALLNTTPKELAIVPGVALGLDFGLAYLLGRASIRSPADLRLFFAWLIPGLVAVGFLLMVESISHRHLLRPFLIGIFGGGSAEDLYFRFRFGLLRAIGPFPHPILGGVFLASMLPLAWYLAHNARQRALATFAAFCAFFTISSTSILGLIIGVGLIAGEIFQRLTRLPFFLLVAFFGGLAASAISVASESGLVSFVSRRLTLDPGSGYYRMLIWEYGMAEAERYPIFGLGQNDWTRPFGMVSNSVDSYWLVLAMFYGFPAMVAALLVMGGALLAVVMSQRFRNADDRRAGAGVVFFLIVIMFSGLSVHLWESLHAWIIMLCGAAVSMSTQARKYAEITGYQRATEQAGEGQANDTGRQNLPAGASSFQRS